MKNQIKKFENSGFLQKKLDDKIQEILNKTPTENEIVFKHKVDLNTFIDVQNVRHVNVTKSGLLIVTSCNYPDLKVLDLTNLGEQKFYYAENKNSVRFTCFDKDETSIFAGSWDRTVRQINLSSGRTMRVFTHPEMGRIPWVNYFHDNGKAKIAACNYASDAVPERNNSVYIFDVETEQLEKIIAEHSRRISAETICLQIDEQNQFLYSGSDDSRIIRYNLRTNTVDKAYSGHRKGIRMLSLFDNNTKLASCSTDGSIQIFETETERLLSAYNEFRSDVMAIKITNDNSKLVAVSFDFTIRIFRLPDLTLLKTINGKSRELWSCDLAFNDQVLITGGEGGAVCFWSMNTYELIAKYYLMANPNDFLWESPPDKEGNACFYTNNPHAYVRVSRKTLNKDVNPSVMYADATYEEAEAYFATHNKPDWIARLLHYDYFKNLNDQNDKRKKLNSHFNFSHKQLTDKNNPQNEDN